MKPSSKSARPPRRPGERHRVSQESFSPAEAFDRFSDVLRHHEFAELPHAQVQLLVDFYFLLMREQEHQNFTRLLKLRDIAIKHFIDCLMVPRLTKLKFPLLDLGSGPGFPGIPLKIFFPNERIILTEGVQKRVEFLKTVRQGLGLKNLDIIGRNINPHFLYPVQGVISRAVEDIPNTLSNVFHSLQTGGRVYFMKGPNVAPEILRAEKEWSEYYLLREDTEYKLPHSHHERRLIVFEKIKRGPLLNLNHILDEEENEHPWKD